MEHPNNINGANILNLITRFFYKKDQLCYRILIQCDVDQLIPFQEFVEYAKYKEAFNLLLEKKANNEVISIGKLNQEISYMSLS